MLRSILLAALPAALACGASAQTTSTATHHTAAHTAARRAAPCAEPKPFTPAGLPPAVGKVQTAYSLRYIDTAVGTGEIAPAHGFFTVNYIGWLASNGTKFDSSYDRHEPATFPVGAHRIIPGWDTGFEGMHVGGKRRLFIPWQLAYGERGAPQGKIGPKADLIFDVELVAVSDKPPAPKAPPAAPAAPAARPATPTPPAAAPSAPAATTPPPPAATQPAAK